MTEERLTILLVDDEPKFLEPMAERIRLKGFEPLLATSGEEALDLAKTHDVFAAVVDLKMPGMDGLTTISKLKEINPEIKSVLLTGFGDEKMKEAAGALDAAYFEKDEMGPFWRFVTGMRVKKPKILLVDDEQKFLDTIADRIRLKGFEPVLASSGEEALELAETHHIFAAVVDQKMPGMDGLTTIARLKELYPDIKTVVLTGFGDQKIKEAAEALDSGFFEKHEMGYFWSFIKRLQRNLENSMAAAGMASYGDLDDAQELTREDKKDKS